MAYRQQRIDETRYTTKSNKTASASTNDAIQLDSTEDNEMTESNREENQLVGDILPQEKDSSTMRIHFQNIRGIAAENWLSWETAMIYAKEHQIDVIGLAETNISWTHSSHNRALQIAMKHNKQTRLTTASSIEAGSTNFLPGGTCCSIHNKWIGRITETLQDNTRMGRWTGFKLTGKADTELIVISAYRPTLSQHGENTNYLQQCRIMRSNNVAMPNPPKQFYRDLAKDIQKWRKEKTEVILMWDANDAIESNHPDLINFMNKTNLAPTHLHFPKATYHRGTKCIDFIMGTPKVRENVISAGYYPFYEGLWSSDHRGLYVDIAADVILNTKTENINQSIPRNLSSKNLKQVDKFIQRLKADKNIDKILKDISALQTVEKWTKEDHAKFEAIDTKFTEALLSAENHSTIPNNAPWSPALHKAYLCVKYWKIKQAGRSTNTQTYQTLLKIEKLINNNALLYGTQSDSPPYYQLK